MSKNKVFQTAQMSSNEFPNEPMSWQWL